MFAGGYGGGPAGLPRDREAFDAGSIAYDAGANRIATSCGWSAVPTTARSSARRRSATSTRKREHAHIGWTGYDPRVWGTQVNPETKLLMLGLAFARGFGRVKLQADDAQRAVARARSRSSARSFEGIVRRESAARRRLVARLRRLLDP